MKMNHFVVEGFCEEKEKGVLPCNGSFVMGVNCFDCKQFSFTSVENELLFSDKNGIAKEIIGFGGAMDPDNYDDIDKYLDLWENICKRKINEAYDEYMKEKDKL